MTPQEIDLLSSVAKIYQKRENQDSFDMQPANALLVFDRLVSEGKLYNDIVVKFVNSHVIREAMRFKPKGLTFELKVGEESDMETLYLNFGKSTKEVELHIALSPGALQLSRMVHGGHFEAAFWSDTSLNININQLIGLVQTCDAVEFFHFENNPYTAPTLDAHRDETEPEIERLLSAIVDHAKHTPSKIRISMVADVCDYDIYTHLQSISANHFVTHEMYPARYRFNVQRAISDYSEISVVVNGNTVGITATPAEDMFEQPANIPPQENTEIHTPNVFGHRTRTRSNGG